MAKFKFLMRFIHTHIQTQRKKVHFIASATLPPGIFARTKRKKIGEKYNLFKANAHELFVLNIHRYATKKKNTAKKKFFDFIM